jgi:dUTP pyrophosphatase
MDPVKVSYRKLHPAAREPRQAHPGDAGWDLFALKDTPVSRPALKAPGPPPLTWVPTGLAMAIPEGYYGRIVGRSSAASRGYHVIEGVIDCGYRGEFLFRVCPLWLPIDEHRDNGVLIRAGESVGQLIVSPVPTAFLVQEDFLPVSQRGESGFGSSGR